MAYVSAHTHAFTVMLDVSSFYIRGCAQKNVGEVVTKGECLNLRLRHDT